MADSNEPLPTRLGKEPLVEALWEIRYRPKHQAASAVILGALVSRAGGEAAPERLPLGEAPAALRESNPALRYSHTHKLRRGSFLYLIGDAVISVSSLRPYVGWSRLRAEILEVEKLASNSGAVAVVERVSLKYVDMIDLDAEPTLDRLTVDFSLGGGNVPRGPIQLRAELRRFGHLHLVTIALPAEAKNDDAAYKGTLIDVDTILQSKEDLARWSENPGALLDAAHDSNKRVFFSMLKPETLALLEPEYAP